MTTKVKGSAAPRLGPHSIEAEEAVLGSILINPDLYPEVSDILKADDFFEVKHAWTWEAIVTLARRGDDIDNLTVVEELRRAGRLDDAGGPPYITYLINNTPTHIYGETYARIVQRAALRRRLLGAATDIANMARSDETDVLELLVRAQQRVGQVADGYSASRAVRLGTASSALYDALEARAQAGGAPGLTTGMRQLDCLLGGLERENLYLIAARPSMGKTALLLNLMRHLARKESARLLVFSFEMSIEQLTARFLALETNLPAEQFRQADFDSDGWASLAEAIARVQGYEVMLEDLTSLTVDQIRLRCVRQQRETGLDAVFIDYLQLLLPEKQRDNEVAELSQISRGLKVLARELKVPVVVAAQVSRAVESRSDKRPTLADLRGSGTLEQDADVVMFLYRDDVYNADSDRPNQAELIVSKNRHGALGMVPLYFRKALMQFTELAR